MSGSESVNFGAVSFNNNKAVLGAGMYIESGTVNISGSGNFGNTATNTAGLQNPPVLLRVMNVATATRPAMIIKNT